MWFGRLGSLTSLMLTHCRQNVDALSFDKLVIAVLMPVSSLTVEVVLQRQVVDAQKFGLPQRRRRLYILGSPHSGKAPVMKGTLLKKPAKLGTFLSKRKKETLPSDLAYIITSIKVFKRAFICLVMSFG